MVEWSLNPLVAIGIAIGVMFFGYFFGLFEGRGQGYRNRKKEEAEEKKNQPPPQPLPHSSPPAPSDEIPVLDVSLNTAGKLRLKLDDQPTDTSALNTEQRKRLIAILTQMRPWLEAPKAAPPPSPPSEPMPASAVSSPGSTPAPTPAPQAASSPDPDNDDEEVPAAAQSIVMQIDSILQEQLLGTPLANMGIRLQESQEGDVNVWVGVNKYEGVDDVPDETIKAVLKTAIAEWENKYTPG